MARAHAPSVHRGVERDEHGDPTPEARPGQPRQRQREDLRRTTSLDHLIIGAPLTAAALGLLLSEGGAPVEAQAGAGSAGGTAPSTDPALRPSGELAGRTTSPGSRTVEPAVDATVGTAHAGSVAGSVAAAEGGTASDEGEPSPAAGTSEGLSVPGAPAPGNSEAGGIVAGASLSISFGSGTDGSAGPAPGTGSDPLPDERGDIGNNVQAGSGDDVIHGTDNDDFLSGGAGNDEIHGHGGNDAIYGEHGDDLLFGGAGDDLLSGGHGRDEIHGGDGDDDLLGGPGADSLYGEAGRDLLVGGSGDDLLDGGAGADRMIGGSGNDALVMGSTHDVALEDVRSADGGGTDTVRIGDAFTDSLPAGLAEEGATFVLSSDVDQTMPDGTATYQQQLDPDVENVHLTGSANHDVVGNEAANRITGNAGDNMLYGGAGQDILSGGGGADLLDGGAGSDLLKGGDGDDILNGGAGRDRLEGGDGDDILDGGLGADQLYGQGGNDTFILGLNDRAVDTIFDQEGVNQVVIAGGEGHDVEAAIAGGDLHIVVDHNPIAVVQDYRQEDFGAIDTGNGIAGIDSLLIGAPGPALPSTSTSSTASSGGEDLLASYLQTRSHVGTNGADTLFGTSGSDWLAGSDGNDILKGAAGHDVLEGGAGDDLLDGGHGDDRYLFSSGHGGLDTIRDADGSNHAELHGFAGAKVEGVMVGSDLWIIAHHAPLFKVENFAGNEDSFVGVQNGDTFIATEDLFG